MTQIDTATVARDAPCSFIAGICIGPHVWLGSTGRDITFSSVAVSGLDLRSCESDSAATINAVFILWTGGVMMTRVWQLNSSLHNATL